jgi:hypothetical protein
MNQLICALSGHSSPAWQGSVSHDALRRGSKELHLCDLIRDVKGAKEVSHVNPAVARGARVVFLTRGLQFGYTRGYFTSEDRWLKTHVS